MSKLFIKNTKSEINVRKSTLYIICKRVKPLKNARFTFCVSEMDELTKNERSRYNENRISQVVLNDAAAAERRTEMMEKKLSAGKVESEDVPLGEQEFVPEVEAYTITINDKRIAEIVERLKVNERLIHLTYRFVKNLKVEKNSHTKSHT